MAVATLTIDLDNLVANWHALDACSASHVETAAVVKADGYGLDAGRVSAALARGGVKTFFVAVAEEGIAVRNSVGKEAEIYVFSGCCGKDAALLQKHNLIPLLNSPEQVKDFLPSARPFGIQLDSGMNRLGMEPEDFAALKDRITAAGPKLVMSHLACADEPDHPQNKAQLDCFREMTDGLSARKSLSATGGTLLGADYHFDLNRPGVGLYGGEPFSDTKAVVGLSIPVIQTRNVIKGETVGYGANWTAQRDSKIATIASGYADGLIRAIGNGNLNLYAGDTPCPLVGRVSMDLITVDVTDLETSPDHLDLLNDIQTVDHLADAAGTIGYEILTSLGARYNRVYKG